MNEARFLARPECKGCYGEGFIDGDVCRCVYRAVFSQVWDKFTEIQHGDRRSSVVYCHESYGCSRPTEEFCADVQIVARRAVGSNQRYRDILDAWFLWASPNSQNIG